MAEPEVIIGGPTASAIGDVEMTGGTVDVLEVLETDATNGGSARNNRVGEIAEDEEGEEEEEEEGQDKVLTRATFVDYLASPIVGLLVGRGDKQTLLSAHQKLLVQSPFLARSIEQFSTTAPNRRIEFADEALDAVGCLLEYLYTGEYYPRRIGDTLEPEPMDSVGEDGAQLLKHARVYTLADKLELPALKALAHSKVHRINSSAKGEIAYARFVYAHTPREDVTIRKPIASFWGQRSHVLRHEAEDDFKRLCLEFPEFGFDVLSYVLDAREKKSSEKVDEPKSGRKRQRNI